MNLLLENFNNEQLQAMNPRARALAQQEVILNKLFSTYRDRIASFLAHADNARHVDMTYLNDKAARWKTANEQEAGANVNYTADQMTTDDRRAWMASTSHPTRASRQTSVNGRNPITVVINKNVISEDETGYPSMMRYSIILATQKTLAPDPKNWQKAVVSNHIKQDLDHIFGAENVTGFSTDNGTYRTNVENDYVAYFKTELEFALPVINPKIVLGAPGVAATIVPKIAKMAKVMGGSNHDALNRIRAAFQLPIVESVTEAFNAKLKNKNHPTCVIEAMITKLSEQPVYMMESCDWTNNMSEAYITTFEEAEDLLGNMMLGGRVYTGKVVKLR